MLPLYCLGSTITVALKSLRKFVAWCFSLQLSDSNQKNKICKHLVITLPRGQKTIIWIKKVTVYWAFFLDLLIYYSEVDWIIKYLHFIDEESLNSRELNENMTKVTHHLELCMLRKMVLENRIISRILQI